jgi:Skp family chaperone for outer membrane proteins
MKRFSLVAVFAILAAISSVSVSAQTTSMKVVVINTQAFDGKEGIVKYTNAMTALENEFKPLDAELQTMVTKYQTLGKELKTLQDQITAGTVPVNQQAAQAKADEYQTLELQIKRKQEDGKVRYEKRFPQVMGPIQNDIGKAMQDFAAAKGYDLILDAAKLDSQQILLAFIPAKVDVTKEFITFYNARPATAATAATPK